MYIEKRDRKNSFFSICIPQYNRTSFLIEACKVLAEQTFKNFEICISDDRSTDGREEELIHYLKHSGLSFIYKKQEKNLRYDGNIRTSIALAQGKYCLLHGNDDCLASATILEELHQEIQKYESIAVVIPNYEDWQTGQISKRIQKSCLVGSGVEVAATHFRNVAFVSGIIIDRSQAQRVHTDRWDGSEMYQMYVTSRIIASGGCLLELDKSVVRKDIQIPEESVDSYRKPRLNPCPIVERKLPMAQIGPLVVDAIVPYASDSCRNKLIESIFLQLYLFTYPFWILEYRRVQSCKYSLGICLGLNPKNTFVNTGLSWIRSFKLHIVYVVTSTIALVFPLVFFESALPFAFKIAKTKFSR